MRRLSFKECWRMGGGVVGFTVAAVCKLIGVNLGSADPVACAIDRIDVVPPEEFPEDVYRRQECLLEEAHSCGLGLRLLYTLPMVGSVGYAALFSDQDLILEVMYLSQKEQVVVACVVISLLPGGRELITTDQKQNFDATPEFEAEFMPGAVIGALLERHRERIRDRRLERVPEDRAELEALALRRNQQAIERLLKRGIYLPCSIAEGGS